MYYSDYNRPPEEREPVIETDQYHVYEAKPPRKRGGKAKIVAIALCCALVGGLVGGGGVLTYNHFAGSRSTIYQSNTPTVAVDLASVDGSTVLTPEQIYAANLGAVVGVNGDKSTTNAWGYTVRNAVSGSGFVISSNATTSYILTNYHVIDGVSDITVFFADGTSYDATLVGGEEENDIAVLKIDQGNLRPVVLGDSDTLVVGEQVSTIGNALGSYSFSQTSGYVSGVGRSVTMSDGTVMNMIQTDCTINSGNSGGPLFNQYGQVVGITSAKLSNNGDTTDAAIEGIGFAIPLNDVIDIVTDYMEYGYVTGRPYMGILNPQNTDDYAQIFGWPEGVYVNGVEEGSCAETAGIQQGDIITRIDDTDITSVSQLTSVKNGYRAGDTVTVTVYRAGQYLELTLTFDEQTTTQSGSGSGTQDPAPEQTSSQGGGYYNPWGGWGGFFD